jgi:hypothetical protein
MDPEHHGWPLYSDAMRAADVPSPQDPRFVAELPDISELELLVTVHDPVPFKDAGHPDLESSAAPREPIIPCRLPTALKRTGCLEVRASRVGYGM